MPVDDIVNERLMSSIGIKLMRSAWAGILTALFEVAFFTVLIERGLNPLIANPLAFVLGVNINFVLSRWWVFSRAGQLRHSEIIYFYLIALIGLFGEIIFFTILYSLSRQAILSKIITILAMFIVNFILKQRLFGSLEERRFFVQLWRIYRGTPGSVRLHNLIRLATCPIEKVIAELPNGGRLLDIGCGHGLVSLGAALAKPNLTMLGLDVDQAKIRAANKAAANLPGGERASFMAASDLNLPKGHWDAIVIVDVLYLLGQAEQKQLVNSCVRRLKPGGRLVIKEMNFTPKWKYWWNLVQETMAVRLFKFTKGRGQLCFTAPKEIAGWLAAAGLKTRLRPLDKGYLHPHFLTIGDKLETPV